MRGSSLVVFFRWIGAAGVGSYAGAAAAGLIAVVTGRVFAASSPWVNGLPGLIPLGAVLTAGVAVITRRWLFPNLTTRRALWGAAAGAVLTPLALAVSHLEDLFPLVLALMAAGWLTTGLVWLRWFRASRVIIAVPRFRAPGDAQSATTTRR